MSNRQWIGKPKSKDSPGWDDPDFNDQIMQVGDRPRLLPLHWWLLTGVAGFATGVGMGWWLGHWLWLK